MGCMLRVGEGKADCEEVGAIKERRGVLYDTNSHEDVVLKE